MDLSPGVVGQVRKTLIVEYTIKKKGRTRQVSGAR